MRTKTNICVSNGRVWAQADLHLKSAIPHFSRFNVVKQIELDLLKAQVR